MTANIIHLPHRKDRFEILQQELQQQNITDFRIWDGIVDVEMPCTGISKAHKQIVKFALHNDLPEILIGEDDLRFTKEGAFRFFIENKPTDFDIYLAGIYSGELKRDNTVEDFSALTFYIVNKKFYSIFLDMPEDKDLDRALRFTGRFVVCYPFTVIQYNGYSDNVKRYCLDDHCLAKRRLFGQE
jgi:hypothetical protein